MIGSNPLTGCSEKAHFLAIVSLSGLLLVPFGCGDSRSPVIDAPPLAQMDAPSRKGAGSVTGPIHGQSIVIADAASSLFHSHVDSSTSAFIMMSTAASLCSDVESNISRAGSTVVVLGVSNATVTPKVAPTGPGDYAISTMAPGNDAVWAVFTRDSACQPIAGSRATATSGSVALTMVNGNVYQGTYDVVLDSGEHVTGAFEPAACPALDQPAPPPKCL